MTDTRIKFVELNLVGDFFYGPIQDSLNFRIVGSLQFLVAVDAVGAGVGEEVFFVRGKEASFPFYPGEPPVDAGIVGIVDHWDVER